MKILVIPEDPTNDQYILKPIVEQMVKRVGILGRVEVLRDPHLHSITQALDPKLLERIVHENKMIDLFLVLVDNDCDYFKAENKCKERQKQFPGKLLYCLAVQEVEMWMMALHEEFARGWQSHRKECHPKENLCAPFLQKMQWDLGPGSGYKRAMRDLGPKFDRLLNFCPELHSLLQELEAWKRQRG